MLEGERKDRRKRAKKTERQSAQKKTSLRNFKAEAESHASPS